MIRSIPLAAALSLVAMLGAEAADLYGTSRRITPGTPVLSGRGVVIGCQTEGRLTLVMNDDSLLETYVFPGTSTLDNVAIKNVNAANTTATCVVNVMG